MWIQELCLHLKTVVSTPSGSLCDEQWDAFLKKLRKTLIFRVPHKQSIYVLALPSVENTSENMTLKDKSWSDIAGKSCHQASFRSLGIYLKYIEMWRLREMAQWLKAHTAFSEDPSSIPSTHRKHQHNHLLQGIQYLWPWQVSAHTHMCHWK